MSDYTHDSAMRDEIRQPYHVVRFVTADGQWNEYPIASLRAYIERIETENERLREVNLPFTEEERLSLLNDVLAWRWFNLGRQDERIRQDRLAATPTDDLKALVRAVGQYDTLAKYVTQRVLEWAGVE